jgi:midasin
MVAKENETPEQPPSNKEEAKPEPDELMDDGDDDEVEEMPEQESHDDARDQGEKMPDHVPEADSLDVPENLDLGEEGEDEGDDDNADENLGDDEKPMDDGLDTPSQKQKTPEPEPAQDGPEGENEPEPTLPDPSEDAADIDPTESNDPAQAEPGEEDAAMDEDEEEDLHSAKPKVEAGNDTSENASAPEESGIETGQEEAPAEQEDGAKDEVGKQADAPSADRQDAGGDNTQDQKFASSSPSLSFVPSQMYSC